MPFNPVANIASNLVINASGAQAGGKITLEQQNLGDPTDDQLWKCEDGFIISRVSGLVIEAPVVNGKVVPGAGLILGVRRDTDNANQKWTHDGARSICNFDRSLYIAEDGNASGSSLIVDKIREGDGNQLWLPLEDLQKE